MSLVTSAEEAEEIAKQWLERKFAEKLRRSRVKEIQLSEGLWNVKAEVVLRSGALSMSSHAVHLKVDAGTAKVIGYSESEQIE